MDVSFSYDSMYMHICLCLYIYIHRGVPWESVVWIWAGFVFRLQWILPQALNIIPIDCSRVGAVSNIGLAFGLIVWDYHVRQVLYTDQKMRTSKP